MESIASSSVLSEPGRKLSAKEKLYVASQWELVWLHFRRHKLALIGMSVVAIMYLLALFHGFVAPYDKTTRHGQYVRMPPQAIHFYDGEKFSLRPFVYSVTVGRDEDLRRVFSTDKSVKYPVRLLVRGDKYKLFGLFEWDVHLFGVEEGGMVLLAGTDELARDVFSRILYGSAISLSIGLVGVFMSFILGSITGGFSGFYGGVVDNMVQRVIEFLMSVPTIPLWMALSAAVPIGWPPLRIYFAMTVILSLTGWTGLSRRVRSKILELREEDYVTAARLAGLSDWQIITRHLLPSLMSLLVVNITLAIPGMILGETALSFLGLGLQPPVVSWGVMLQAAQNIGAVVTYPWFFTPVIPIIIFVLGFNLMGDGLRDAADPYKL